jgi:hypothetical protein
MIFIPYRAELYPTAEPKDNRRRPQDSLFSPVQEIYSHRMVVQSCDAKIRWDGQPFCFSRVTISQAIFARGTVRN